MRRSCATRGGTRHVAVGAGTRRGGGGPHPRPARAPPFRVARAAVVGGRYVVHALARASDRFASSTRPRRARSSADAANRARRSGDSRARRARSARRRATGTSPPCPTAARAPRTVEAWFRIAGNLRPRTGSAQAAMAPASPRASTARSAAARLSAASGLSAVIAGVTWTAVTSAVMKRRTRAGDGEAVGQPLVGVVPSLAGVPGAWPPPRAAR